MSLAGSGLVLFLGVGCASFSSFQTADTLGAGKVQFGVEGNGWGFAPLGSAYNGGFNNSGAYAFPHVSFSARYGLTDRIDFGGKIGGEGLGLEGKFLLTDPSDPKKAISLAPSISGFFYTVTGSGATSTVDLPLLIGFKFGDGNQLILGPRLANFFFYSGNTSSNGVTSANIDALLVGTSLGVSFKIGDSFRVLPEVAVLYPLAFLGGNYVQVTSSGVSAVGNVPVLFFHAGIGVLFGPESSPTP